MRADLTPSVVRLTDSGVVDIAVTVTNTADIISGHTVRVLGADPEGVTVEPPRLALFPGGSGVLLVSVVLPKNLPAGTRTLTVQVMEETTPVRVLSLPVEVEVPAKPRLRLSLEPRALTAGRRGPFAIVAENEGNSRISLPLTGADEEAAIGFTFTPDRVDLEPGARAAIDVEVAAKRRIAGQLVVRPFTVAAADPVAVEAGEEPLAVTQGTFIQKPFLSRSAISLVGLLAAVSVFALILTLALTKVTSQSAADRDLALQVALGNAASTSGTGAAGISGTVRLLTSGAGVGGVTVDVFSTSDTSNPVTSTATSDSGGYTLGALAAGGYKLRFRGAGFAELWYPDSLTDSDASEVDVQPAAVTKGIDVTIGGLPASLAGTVTGTGSAGAGATVTLEVAGSGAPVITDIAAPDGSAAGDTGGVQVAATPAATPAATAVPLPVVATPQPGVAATSTSAASANIQLPSDRIVGLQNAAAVEQQRPRAPVGTPQPLSLTIPTPDTAGDGGTSKPASTIAGAVLQTVTADAGGAFAFAQVPSPGVYDIIVRKAGYAISTERIDLSGGENRKDVLVRLQQGDGLIAGSVGDAKGPVGLATVTASDGLTSVQTYTDNTGAFTLRGLSTPSTYTVTVAKSGYATEDLSYQLSTAQKLTGVDVTLSAESATLTGLVSYQPDTEGPSAQLAGAPVATQPAPGVTVTVSNGSLSLSTVTESAGVAGSEPGRWAISGLPVPDNYTVTFSRSDLAAQTVAVTVDALGKVGGSQSGTASTAAQLSPTMIPATASVHGLVTQLAVNNMPAQQLGDVPVTLSSTTATYSVTTASTAGLTGYYEIDNVAPGTYTLSAARAGTRGTTQVVVLSAGQNANEPIGLGLPASISGTITGGAGQPLYRAEVRLFLAANYPNTPVTTTLTAQDGTFRFPDVDAPANYVVDADFPAGSSPGASRTLTVQPSTAYVVNLQLGTTTTATTPPATPTPTPTPVATQTPSVCPSTGEC